MCIKNIITEYRQSFDETEFKDLPSSFLNGYIAGLNDACVDIINLLNDNEEEIEDSLNSKIW